jgi:predicted amidohydrolase
MISRDMNTRARIATVCQNRRGGATADEQRRAMMELLREALKVRPDMVCLPETFTLTHITAPEIATEPVDGPTVTAAAKLAKEGNCYVICPQMTRRDGVYRNSAVIIGRRGEIVGIYDKRQPVTSTHDYTKMEDGMMPGQGDGVFDLDFGRIGVRICFDIGFPDDWKGLAEKDVRLVVWSSAYNGGFPLQAYASMHEYYVVSSVRTDSSRIIDPCGTVLSRTDGTGPIIWRDINLDFLVAHTDFNYGIPGRIEKAYGNRVAVRRYGDEGALLIEPADPAVRTDALKKEFGLESRREYLCRHEVAYEQLLAGKMPVPQAAGHGNRPMYSAE